MCSFIYNWYKTMCNVWYNHKTTSVYSSSSSITPLDDVTVVSIDSIDYVIKDQKNSEYNLYSESRLNRVMNRMMKKNNHKENRLKLYTIQHKIRNFQKLNDKDLMDIYYFANEEKFFMIQLLLFCINCLMEYNDLNN
jgi:hypothetical protein